MSLDLNRVSPAELIAWELVQPSWEKTVVSDAERATAVEVERSLRAIFTQTELTVAANRIRVNRQNAKLAVSSREKRVNWQRSLAREANRLGVYLEILRESDAWVIRAGAPTGLRFEADLHELVTRAVAGRGAVDSARQEMLERLQGYDSLEACDADCLCQE